MWEAVISINMFFLQQMLSNDTKNHQKYLVNEMHIYI